MSPVPRLARRVTLLAILVLMALAGVAVAQDPEPIQRTLTVGVLETGCEAIGAKDPCWDVATLVAQPGDTVTLIADLRWSANVHNIHVKGVEGEPKTGVAPVGYHEVNFTMPSGSKGVTFVCDVHPTMTSTILPPVQAAAAGGGADHGVPGLGVSFLAYWVGLIAFALLFIVYGLTFYLFKYNETPTTTDQWDRSTDASESKRRFSPGAASMLALVFAAIVIAGIVYAARLA